MNQQKQVSNPELFRKVALDRLSNPEQLDRLIQIANPQGWIALVTVGVLILGFAVWSVTGNIRTIVDGQGLLIADETRRPEVKTVTLRETGVIQDILVQPQQNLAEGQVIALVETPSGVVEVTSPTFGRVAEIIGTVGSIIKANDPFMLVLAPPPLVGKIYVNLVDAQELKPGLHVEIFPITVSSQEFGFIRGKVVQVGDFPATDSTAQAFTPKDGVVIEVMVSLETANTLSGYEWSLAAGPETPLQLNSACLVKIIVAEEHPISRVFPILD